MVIAYFHFVGILVALSCVIGLFISSALLFYLAHRGVIAERTKEQEIKPELNPVQLLPQSEPVEVFTKPYPGMEDVTSDRMEKAVINARKKRQQRHAGKIEWNV